jgi:hypothetical protein
MKLRMSSTVCVRFTRHTILNGFRQEQVDVKGDKTHLVPSASRTCTLVVGSDVSTSKRVVMLARSCVGGAVVVVEEDAAGVGAPSLLPEPWNATGAFFGGT